jgi:outer membrane protein assembly factor BamB
VRRYHLLVPLLASLALAAGEPLTTTAWDVRKDAEELLDELGKANGQAGDLIQRTQTMLATHGDALIAVSPGEAVPLSTALADRLRTAGLIGRFAADFGPGAERRLDELLATRPDPVRLAALARSVPATTAAERAWRLVADLAWDRGAVRYHSLAAGAMTTLDEGRRARLAVVADLLARPSADLPATLERLDVMWRVPINEVTSQPAGRRRPQQRSIRPGFAAIPSGAVTMSDGRSLVVIDHLVGSQLGPRLALGDVPLPDHVARPEPLRDGAVAAGLAGGRIIVVCAGSAGGERWRHTAQMEGVDAISAPVTADGLIAIAYRASGSERIELRMLALSVRDGSPQWDVPVAHLATPRWGADGLAAPALASHALGFAVCSNAGTLALVGHDGQVQRLWTYPTRPDLDMEGQRRGRRGLAASDGTTLVATPADHAGLVLVLGAADRTPRAYRGDGADGDVLAVHGGEALIAGRQVALIDTARLRLRWTAALRLPDAQGLIGAQAVLVAGTDQLALLARGDGRMVAGRALVEPAAIASADGILVLGDNQAVRGFGDAVAFLERLRSAATGSQDPRPHAALASVLAGRGETDAALAAWRQALALGGGGEVAQRMARLLRARISDGGAQAGNALDELTALQTHLPGLGEETALWRAHLREAAGDQAGAAGGYTAILSRPDRPLSLADGLSVSLHLLARGGAQQCGVGDSWQPLTRTVPPAPMPGQAWRIPAHARGRTVVAGGMVASYANGLLRAWSLADGREVWRRTPQRALLGVQPWREASPLGVAIAVLPGSAAESVGLRDGEVLTVLNGKPMRDFDADLRQTVLTLGNGGAFTFTVLGRDGKERQVSGTLGGEPMEPLACDGDILLARTTMPLMPNRSDLRVFAIDLRTGADLWSHVLSHDEERLARTMPLLAAGLVIAADGADLVAFARDGRPAWRLAGRADLLQGATLLGRTLWMPAAGGDGLLLDPLTGAELAIIPAVATDTPAVISGDSIAVRHTDDRVGVWDLARGRLRCRTASPARPLALRQDAILVLDARGRPQVFDSSTGALRRNLSDAPAETWAVGERLAVLALAGAERRSLVGIALDGLVLRWSLDLPPGLEIESLVIGPSGPLARLREGTRTWALQLDEAGVPVAVGGWNAEATGEAVPLARGALLATPGEMRIQLPGLPPAPAALRCGVLDAARPLREAVHAALPGLAWSSEAGPALALLRHGVQLVILVRSDQPETTLRVVDPGGAVAVDAARALITGGSTKLTIPGGWTLGERWTLPGTPAIAVSTWTPLPSRASGSPLAVLLDERAGAPWWLLAGWIRVLDPP